MADFEVDQPAPVNRKKLLIVHPRGQFGYQTSSYYLSIYLQADFDITYVCWDYGLDRIEEKNVQVKYISRAGGKIQRLWRYVSCISREIKATPYDLVYVVHFYLCSLLRFLANHPRMILDIRTGRIGPREAWLQRKAHNLLIRLESLFFEKVVILSDSLRADLGIAERKCHIFPLGAEQHPVGPKRFDAMRLLYVGTLAQRSIEKTVEGFALFRKEVSPDIGLSYDIVGFGTPEAEGAVENAIRTSGCRDLVRFHGRVPQKRLGPFLEHGNIGVAFVPIDDRYQSQPSTKIFEYHLAGMPVLATATRENARSIKPENGVLVNDDPEDFCNGLRLIHRNLSTYDSEKIKAGSADLSWESIVRRNLAPCLSAFLAERGR